MAEKKDFSINEFYNMARKGNEALKDKDLCAIIDMGNNNYEFYLGERKAEVLEPEKMKKLLESINEKYLFKTKFGDWNVYIFPKSELEKYLENLKKPSKEVEETAEKMEKAYGPKIEEKPEKKKQTIPRFGIIGDIYQIVRTSLECIYDSIKESFKSVFYALKDVFSYKK